MDQTRLNLLILPLIDWYGRARRVLPWREDPSPYRVWVSEIMLQQTRVSTAIEYFNRFVAELPTIPDLAAAPEDRLLKLWQGLGYYNRVRNLQKGAREVCEKYHGELPRDIAALRSITGIGDYTAGAIGSIAFGLKTPAVDGNVLRVVSRVTGDTRDIGDVKLRAEYADLLRPLMPDGFESAFTQSLMELGALVCVPNGKPHCEDCPAKDLCVAGRDHLWERIPVKSAKKGRRVEHREVYLLVRDGRVAIAKRPATGLLAGLYEFPNALKGERPEYLQSVVLTACGKAKHIFTHVEWRMELFSAMLPEKSGMQTDLIFASGEELNSAYPIPSAFSAALKRAKALL